MPNSYRRERAGTRLILVPHMETSRTPAWPAIVYSTVGRGRTPSAVPSNSNFPASHLHSKPGLVADLHLRNSARYAKSVRANLYSSLRGVQLDLKTARLASAKVTI
jgi:hypothetical protein